MSDLSEIERLESQLIDELKRNNILTTELKESDAAIKTTKDKLLSALLEYFIEKESSY